MIEPYWKSADGRHVIYNADCLQVLSELEAGSVDAVVTDPPYEGMKGGTVINHAGVSSRVTPTVTVGTELGVAKGLELCRNVARFGAISFCSYHWIEDCFLMLGGTKKALISWFKRNSPYSVNNSPWFMTEYAWAVQYHSGINWRNLRTHIDVPMLQAGCMASERIIVNGGKSAHPAQKPIAVMQSVILPGMDIVLDPFAGTGTTGVACVRTNRRFIGIEIEKRYCEIAVKRMERELSQPMLPFVEPEKVEQATMFNDETEGES